MPLITWYSYTFPGCIHHKYRARCMCDTSKPKFSIGYYYRCNGKLSTLQKSSMCFSDYIRTTFFYLWRSLKKLADDNTLQHLKVVSTIIIKHMNIKSFTMDVDWPEIESLCLMEVSLMFDICTYLVFTLYSSYTLCKSAT